MKYYGKPAWVDSVKCSECDAELEIPEDGLVIDPGREVFFCLECSGKEPTRSEQWSNEP